MSKRRNNGDRKKRPQALDAVAPEVSLVQGGEGGGACEPDAEAAEVAAVAQNEVSDGKASSTVVNPDGEGDCEAVSAVVPDPVAGDATAGVDSNDQAAVDEVLDSDPDPDPDSADADTFVTDPDTALALDLATPDEAFCKHLLENYEWRTTGKRGYNWSRAVAKYCAGHPMQFEARPSLAETTGFLTGEMSAGVKYSAAMQTLFPVGTSVEGDRAVRLLATGKSKKSSRPPRYVGGPSTLALWENASAFVTITADAAEAARTENVQMSFPMDTILGVVTGRCICVDLRRANITSPVDDLPIVGALMHMTTMSKQLVVLYDILMEKGDRFDLISVPLYYAIGSFEAGRRQRTKVLSITPLDNPPEPGAYDWINEYAWLETAPFLDKLFAMALTDQLDVREVEDRDIPTFICFANGEIERREKEYEEELARQAEVERAAAEQAERDRAAAKAAAAAEAERAAAEQAARAEEERRQREQDIQNLPAIKQAAANAEQRCAELEKRIEKMQDDQRDLLAAYNAQGAQLAKEQSLISNMVSKTATLTHNLQTAEENARKAQAEAAAVRERAQIFDTLEFPQNTLGALLLAKRAFPDRLLVLEQAERSAREFTAGDVRETWAALRDMAVVLWPLMFGEESVDIPARFEEKSVLRIAMTEGPMTQKDPQLMRLRKVEYNGRVEDMSAHLKGRIGEGQTTLRVHFFPDHEKKLLVIGHCGTHLPTYAYQSK